MRSVEKPLSSGESVLIPRKGSLNNVMYVDEKFWTVDTMFFTIPLKPGAAKYVYQYTKRLDFGTMNSGSAVPSMTTKILNSLVIPIPSDSALVSFNKKLQPFFDLFGKNEEENRRLVSLRDILLPKLMSGEIDVSKVDLTQLTNNHLVEKSLRTIIDRYKRHARSWQPTRPTALTLLSIRFSRPTQSTYRPTLRSGGRLVGRLCRSMNPIYFNM